MNEELQKLLDEIGALYYETNDARRIKILVEEDYEDLEYRDEWDSYHYLEHIKELEDENNSPELKAKYEAHVSKITEKIEILKAAKEQVENDSKHYLQMWEDAKKSFIAYKENALKAQDQKKESEDKLRELQQ